MFSPDQNPISFILLIAGCAVLCYFLSPFLGWYWLSRSYRDGSGFEGPYTVGAGSVGLEHLGYRNGFLGVALTERGIHLLRTGLLPLAELTYPPLLIPWSEIQGVHFRRFLFFKKVVVITLKASKVTIEIPLSHLDPLRRRLSNHAEKQVTAVPPVAFESR